MKIIIRLFSWLLWRRKPASLFARMAAAHIRHSTFGRSALR